MARLRLRWWRLTAVLQALAQGAMLEFEVTGSPYGNRQGDVRHTRGNVGRISQRLMPGPYSP